MEIAFGFNHINNLKDFGKTVPSDMNAVNIEKSQDGDYRGNAFSIAKQLAEVSAEFKGQFELVSKVGNKISWQPFKASDFEVKTKFDKNLEDEDISYGVLVESVYDSILDGFGIKSKYL